MLLATTRDKRKQAHHASEFGQREPVPPSSAASCAQLSSGELAVAIKIQGFKKYLCKERQTRPGFDFLRVRGVPAGPHGSSCRRQRLVAGRLPPAALPSDLRCYSGRTSQDALAAFPPRLFFVLLGPMTIPACFVAWRRASAGEGMPAPAQPQTRLRRLEQM